MSQIANGKENIWSFLLLSGYLKATEKYKDIIRKWFQESFIDTDFTNMLKALVIGEVELLKNTSQAMYLKALVTLIYQAKIPSMCIALLY